jgi:hypothetical protein
MPELPPDWAMPEQEIVHHSACEVQDALRYLAQRPPPKSVFVAADWTVKISLNPKIDADVSASAGITSKSPGLSTATRFVTWVAGGPTGATAETKGERTGNLDFVFDAGKLIADQGLDCEHEPFALHSLTKRIGIEDWLVRSVEAAARTHSKIDKPSFSSDVYMKFSGSGSYTYAFPAGTNLLGLGGYYQLEETLNVNLTAKTPTKRIVATTLPPGGKGFNPNAGRAVTSSVTTLQDTRSDLQQIEQAIRNNKLNTQ